MMYKNRLLYWTVKIYSCFIYTGDNLQSLLLLYMRLTWGLEFFRSGLAKLHGIEKVIAFFYTLHIPHPDFHSHLVAYTETIAGLCLFIGLGSRLAAIPLIIAMCIALSIAHAPNLSKWKLFLEPMNLVHETPYPFLMTSLMVFMFGPGKISIDAWIKRWVQKQPKY